MERLSWPVLSPMVSARSPLRLLSSLTLLRWDVTGYVFYVKMLADCHDTVHTMVHTGNPGPGRFRAHCVESDRPRCHVAVTHGTMAGASRIVPAPCPRASPVSLPRACRRPQRCCRAATP